MATEFDPRRSIPPPEGAELTAEQKGQRKIEEYLIDAEQDSPRFQAYYYHSVVQHALGFVGKMAPSVDEPLDEALVETVIGKPSNEDFEREYKQVQEITRDYKAAAFERESNNPEGAQLKLAQGLIRIGMQEIERQIQQALTPPRQ